MSRPPLEQEPPPTYRDIAQMVGSIRDEVASAGGWTQQQSPPSQQQQQGSSRSKRHYFDVKPSTDTGSPEAKRDRRW